jgi:hypothetical protein
MTATTRNNQPVRLLEFTRGDDLSPELYAMGELLHSVDDGDRCVRIFAR